MGLEQRRQDDFIAGLATLTDDAPNGGRAV
jgi:hypothetical protein